MAQDEPIAEEKVDKKANNLIDYSDKLNIKLFSSVKSNEVIHYDGDIKQDFEYKPNEATNIGFGVSYKWLGLDLGFNIHALNNDDDTYGKTTRVDLQADFYLEKFFINLNFQGYTGYYGANPQDYDPDFDNNQVYPLRQDMTTGHLGVSAFYIFNHQHFSYRAAFAFNQRQMKSAGSFLAGTYVNLYKMNADSTLVPYQIQPFVDPKIDFRDVSYVSYGLSGGYAHTFIFFKNFYLSLTLALGFGIESGRRPESDELPEYSASHAGAFIIARTSLGFNGEKWYGGFITGNSASNSANEDISHLGRSVSNVKLFIGRRLVAPSLKKKK